jgi:lipid-binding SYLF domain-containing protein
VKKKLVLFLMTGLVLGPTVGPAAAQSTSKEEKQQEKAEKKEEKAEENRSEIDAMAKQTLQELFEQNADAKDLYSDAYGHAAFAQTEAKLMLSTGSGRGVAHRKSGGEPIYMRMASAGVGVGLGVQRVRVVFLFETQQRFDQFVNKGWDADASASAAAGTEGANVKASFVDGMAIFQFTKAGLIAQASVKGTKYWKADKLNEGESEE